MIESAFKMRFLSAALLGPLILFALFYSDLSFKILIGLAFGLSVHEWMAMARKGDRILRDSLLGIAYLLFCFWSLMVLRLEVEQGLFLTFCLVLGVWASDIGAYFSGKFIGGAKLAVKISPNKTWAGLVGGMLASALALAGLNVSASFLGGVIGVSFDPFASIPMALVIGAMFTIVGQAGDLLISGYKRRVGVKDTGRLIPGHGGILDRIDALLLVAPFFLMVLLELSR